MDNRLNEEQLKKEADQMTEGMDFTYPVHQIIGKNLTETQEKTKEAFESAFSGYSTK